ncbi:hypothetical protein Q9290_08225 [Oceanimonas sp. CHS3-5]|uniref:hypothetical protein n=1 Tax=Oceanimonas sp. CHS3-5 TaxID=3068186 RepID=UPI00273D5BC9|nr:hypothetical protein [Oceanimonas sp. CHS3-5]MDP5292272.1 hypothetical protein [Oceanimonas sp. CHS3-5]
MKTCIIVLGMHRSGTSALTGTLEKIGVMLPQDLWPAQEDNPKGFFEGQKVVDINTRVIAANGSNYDDTRFNITISEESIVQHLDEAKNFIQEEFSYSKCFALKDPRMCITFPFWERVLLELGITIKVVIPYRNPFEVSRSLKKRNNFSTEKSLLLWAKHLLLAEKYSRIYPRYFISFNSLMANTADILPELAHFVEVELSKNTIATVKEQFLDPTLKHHNIDINNVAENIPGFIRELISFVQHDSFKDVTEKKWNAIFNEVSSLYQFLHTYDVQFQSQISRDLHVQRDQAINQAHSFKEQLEQQAELNQSEIAALESEKDRLSRQKNQLQQELEQSREQMEILESEKSQLLKHQSRLEQKAEQLLQDLNSIKEAKRSQMAELQSQINTLNKEKVALNEESNRLEQQLKKQTQVSDQQLLKIQTKLTELEQSHAQEVEQNQAQIKLLKQKNDQLLECQTKQEQEAEQLLQDLDSIKKARQAQKDELQSHIDRLSKEKAALHEESHKLEQQLREQTLSSEQALQEKDQQLLDLKQSYAQQIEQSQVKINNLESENSELLKIKDELSQEVNSLTESIDIVVKDLDILKKQKKPSRIYSILGFSKVIKNK